jgi:hypothetical protein
VDVTSSDPATHQVNMGINFDVSGELWTKLLGRAVVLHSLPDPCPSKSPLAFISMKLTDRNIHTDDQPLGDRIASGVIGFATDSVLDFQGNLDGKEGVCVPTYLTNKSVKAMVSFQVLSFHFWPFISHILTREEPPSRPPMSLFHLTAFQLKISKIAHSIRTMYVSHALCLIFSLSVHLIAARRPR